MIQPSAHYATRIFTKAELRISVKEALNCGASENHTAKTISSQGEELTDISEKTIWGQAEKLGKGTKANYDTDKKIITFCFNRSPRTSNELLKTTRELLIKELRELGYVGRIKYNGEVVVDNISDEDVVLVKKNHKLMIHLNKKQIGDKDPSGSNQ